MEVVVYQACLVNGALRGIVMHDVEDGREGRREGG